MGPLLLPFNCRLKIKIHAVTSFQLETEKGNFSDDSLALFLTQRSPLSPVIEKIKISRARIFLPFVSYLIYACRM